MCRFVFGAASVTEYSDLEISIEIPPLGYLMFRLALSFSHIPSAGWPDDDKWEVVISPKPIYH